MGKEIVSPVKRFSGSVVLHDPLTFPQYLAWKEAVKSVQELTDRDEIHALLVPGIRACVETWKLEGVNPEQFPATPRIASAQLIAWLSGEIGIVIRGEEEIPND